MICSMAVLVCFGYAVGGAGGYLVGQGRPRAIIFGLLGGAVLVCASLQIWKSYIADVEIIDARDREGGSPPP
jgi:hypothetical protein